MKFFVTGVLDIKNKLNLILKELINQPLKINDSQEKLIEIQSPSGNKIEIKTEYKSVYIRFGIGDDTIEFNHHARDEERYIKEIIKLIIRIISEEMVSIQYKQLWVHIGEIIPISEINDYKNRKNFKCVSWNGKYNYQKNG